MTLAEQVRITLRVLGMPVITPHGPGLCVCANHGLPASNLLLTVQLDNGQVAHFDPGDVSCPA